MKLTILSQYTPKDGSASLVQKAIRWWTGSKVFHTAIMLDDTVYEAHIENGVVRRKFDIREEYNLYYRMSVEVDKKRGTYLASYLDDQVGCKYDTLGILLSQVVPFGIDKDDAWFCSELACKALQVVGVVQVTDLRPNKVSPAKLANLMAEKGLTVV